MKKIILILILCTLVYSNDSNITHLKDRQEFEEAKLEMSKSLEKVEEHFVQFEEYEKRVRLEYKKIEEDSKICERIETLYKRTKNEEYKSEFNLCREQYTQKLIDYLEVTKQFRDLKKKMEKRKEEYDSLKLKKEMIESVFESL